jgi:hypothetical protein
MSKLTAVEWLAEKYILVGMLTTPMVERAKAIERDQMLELISFVRVHNKMGKTAEDLLEQFEAYKGGEQ